MLSYMNALPRTLRRLRKGLDYFLPPFVDAMRSGYLPKLSYSQDGEDLALLSLQPKDGFYVDVGAHHPDRFSVTKLLYGAGWRGLNIDITNAMSKEFPSRRPRDLNLKMAVGQASSVTIFRFAEQALNTSDVGIARERIRNGRKFLGEEVLKCEALQSILDRLQCPKKIDLLSVDVEGAELDVLRSLDWAKTDVSAVLVELKTPAHQVRNHPISRYLERRGLLPALVFERSVLFRSNP